MAHVDGACSSLTGKPAFPVEGVHPPNGVMGHCAKRAQHRGVFT